MEARVSRSLPTNHLFTTISTPLCLGAWKQHLVNHPDQDFVRFIVKGMEEGFPIGVDPAASFMSARRNMSLQQDLPSTQEETAFDITATIAYPGYKLNYSSMLAGRPFTCALSNIP